MANVIKLKTGTSTPTTDDLVDKEVAIDTSAQKFYIRDDTAIKEIGGGGGGGSGDKISEGNTEVETVDTGTDGHITFTTEGTEILRITSTGAWAIEGASNYGTSGQVLTSNGNDAPTWQNASGGGGGSSTLAGLTDVTISSASNGQVLKYNGSEWVNGTDNTGGGGGGGSSGPNSVIMGMIF